MPQAWRIVHKKYASTAFSGEGARLAGGRWNSEGFAMVYTAGSLSLALLEIIVHLEFKEALKHYKAIPLSIPDRLILSVAVEDLPEGWSAALPHPTTQLTGNRWLDQQAYAVLEVPSAIIPFEHNYLLNPRHPEFNRIKTEPPIDLPIDPRIISKLN